MNDIHQLNSLPEKTTLDLLTSYGIAFEDKNCDYHQLLKKLQSTIMKGQFMDQQDNAAWMNHRGNDYLANPKLFSHAPLTYLCAFLSELFKKNSVKQIEKNVSPEVFKAVLKRLENFK